MDDNIDWPALFKFRNLFGLFINSHNFKSYYINNGGTIYNSITDWFLEDQGQIYKLDLGSNLTLINNLSNYYTILDINNNWIICRYVRDDGRSLIEIEYEIFNNKSHKQFGLEINNYPKFKLYSNTLYILTNIFSDTQLIILDLETDTENEYLYTDFNFEDFFITDTLIVIIGRERTYIFDRLNPSEAKTWLEINWDSISYTNDYIAYNYKSNIEVYMLSNLELLYTKEIINFSSCLLCTGQILYYKFKSKHIYVYDPITDLSDKIEITHGKINYIKPHFKNRSLIISFIKGGLYIYKF